MFQPGPDWSGPPMAVLLNKTDLLGEEQIQELQDWYLNNCRAEKVRGRELPAAALLTAQGTCRGCVLRKVLVVNPLFVSLCVPVSVSPQVFVGSALESSDAGVEAIKAWAVDKLPEGPTLYPKVSLCVPMCVPHSSCCDLWVGSVCVWGGATGLTRKLCYALCCE